ncbi:MAG: SIMPL domain-containing protein [Aeromicrobium erythreum]
MSLQITVRGSAEATYRAERVTVRLRVQAEGDDRAQVHDEASGALEPIVDQLRELESRGAVLDWSTDQVHVLTHTPVEEGQRSAQRVHVASVGVVAEFVDFERMSGFVDYWSGREVVQVDGLEWDVLARHRRAYEAEARKAAVDDAVAKAQAYADAVRRGRVVAVELSDPGMLDHAGEPPWPRGALTKAAFTDGGGLVLEPPPIVVAVQVDGRFTAS